MGVLDFIFPKYCVNCRQLGSYLCENCFIYLSFDTQSLCLICKRASINNLTHPVCRSRFVLDGAFSGIVYNRIAKRLIYRFKYNPYISDLKGLLVEFLLESVFQNEVFYRILEANKSLVFVPIPLYKSKFKARGYNQAEILADEICARLGLIKINAIERIKNTHSQAGLKEKERKENITGAFGFKKGGDMQGKTILLVDDILTTGSTLLEAGRVLKKAGAKAVFGLTLAQD